MPPYESVYNKTIPICRDAAQELREKVNQLDVSHTKPRRVDPRPLQLDAVSWRVKRDLVKMGHEWTVFTYKETNKQTFSELDDQLEWVDFSGEEIKARIMADSLSRGESFSDNEIDDDEDDDDDEGKTSRSEAPQGSGGPSGADVEAQGDNTNTEQEPVRLPSTPQPQQLSTSELPDRTNSSKRSTKKASGKAPDPKFLPNYTKLMEAASHIAAEAESLASLGPGNFLVTPTSSSSSSPEASGKKSESPGSKGSGKKNRDAAPEPTQTSGDPSTSESAKLLPSATTPTKRSHAATVETDDEDESHLHTPKGARTEPQTPPAPKRGRGIPPNIIKLPFRKSERGTAKQRRGGGARGNKKADTPLTNTSDGTGMLTRAKAKLRSFSDTFSFRKSWSGVSTEGETTTEDEVVK